MAMSQRLGKGGLPAGVAHSSVENQDDILPLFFSPDAVVDGVVIGHGKGCDAWFTVVRRFGHPAAYAESG